MAKEISRTTRAAPAQDVDQELDHTDAVDRLVEALAQVSGPSTVITGPEWASQFRPPSIPGTINDKYVKAVLPIRAVAVFLAWVTWDWKRGAFVALVLFLVALLIKTRV